MLQQHLRASLIKAPRRLPIVDDADYVNTVPPVLLDWPEGIPKPRLGLVVDRGPAPYWTRFRRFLDENSIPYELFDVHASDWLEKAKKFDGIIWRPASSPVGLEEARRKIYVLERKLGKIIFPSFSAVQFYEDKIMQYDVLKELGFPIIETFISNDHNEALAYIQQCSYPFVDKIVTGSASVGVKRIDSEKQALKVVNHAFSPGGRLTYWPYLRQKNYVYFQKFEPNEGYDLRILVIGAQVFGYYREAPERDFRASGMGQVHWKELPDDALEIAASVADQLDIEMLAVDFLRRQDGTLAIIEVSPFIRVDTPGQLKVNGVPGIYDKQPDGTYLFRQGEFWPQEVALVEFLHRRWITSEAVGGLTEAA